MQLTILTTLKWISVYRDIIERGHGTGFCMGNIDKYSNRYGKKGNKTEQRKDLVKIMHYALIQLHIHDNSV